MQIDEFKKTVGQSNHGGVAAPARQQCNLPSAGRPKMAMGLHFRHLFVIGRGELPPIKEDFDPPTAYREKPFL